MNEHKLQALEDFAFYESGLSAHGCLENLDSYAREAIKKYGRHLLKNQERINKRLYGVALHVYELSKEDPIVVIGPNLFYEMGDAINQYEQNYDI
jgi:hypothetical protein